MNKIEANTPTLRLIALLEVIATKDQFFSLQSLSEELGIPKATLHRMLHLLEDANFIMRQPDGRHYSTAQRLHSLAENILINNTVHGIRHQLLRQLVENIGESCNLTACNGNEVLYLDRVETNEALRFYLHPGSRVPVHCSASGKLFLAQMPPAQRQRLIHLLPLQAFTNHTITSASKLEEELEMVRHQGYAIDNEEFLPGLICLAVLVPNNDHISNLALATQAPIIRTSLEKTLGFLPALQQAAKNLEQVENAHIPKSTSTTSTTAAT